MLSEDVKQEIQAAYRQFLKAKKLNPRYGQRLMIADIARTLGAIEYDKDGKRTSDNHVCVVEAGTGTGKTLSYLLAVMPLAQQLDKKVVLATATVALQDQVVKKDIPDVLRNSGLSFSYALAKGRGRYLCLNKLDRMMMPGQENLSLALWEDQQQFAVEKSEAELYRELDKAVEQGSWDGDRDSWPQAIEDITWRRVTNDHRGCTGRNCGFYEDCPFFQARNDIYRSDLIVANHDLVLADLAMGGGMVLPPPEDTIYIFDEGHHLPDKALNHFSCSSQLRSTLGWLQDVKKMLDSLIQTAGEDSVPASVLEHWKLQTPVLEEYLGQLLRSLTPLSEQSDQIDAERGRWVYRFPNGVIPDDIRQQVELLTQPTRELNNQLVMLVDWLQDGLDGKRPDINRHEAESWMPVVSTQQARADVLSSVWDHFQKADDERSPPCARWLGFSESHQSIDIELSACPVLASEVLSRYLWYRAFAAVVTSATLSALGTFDRFRFRSGIPAASHLSVVPSPFDYENSGVIRVPALACDPVNAARHTEQLVEYLCTQWDTTKGTLILFSSRRQMEDVYERLPDDVQKHVLAQGSLGKREIVEKHRAAIDKGKSSLIFGLASFAEGVDLPGDYCTRVVIVRLPFSVPEDPVDATLAEWIQNRGRNPFMDITVPDAAIRLKQAVGRLLRSEQDKGEVVLFDRRILEKRYGKALLRSLPPFPLVTE